MTIQTSGACGIGPHNCWVPRQSPKVDSAIATELKKEFGDSALTSVEDERFRGLHGSYINGEEMIIPQDISKFLGKGWKEDEGAGPRAYVLQSTPDGNSQRMKFDIENRQSTLTSTWTEESQFDGTAHINTITVGANGSVTNRTGAAI